MTRPNIVWLMCDHLVYAHHKQLTGYPQLPTFDRLAAQGICFDQAFSVTPVCTPARASMFTGVYPHRHGMIQNDGQGGGRLDFDPDEKLFSHYLKQADYRVGLFGKWHTGVERTAQDYGFEGFSCEGYGHPYWSAEYDAYLNEFDLPHAEVTVEWKFGDPSWAGKTIKLKDFPKPYQTPYYLMESCGVLNTPVETHEAYFLAHLADRWLEDVAEGDQPFCLRVDMWGPHHPYWVADPYLNTVNPATLPQYPSFGSSLSHRPQNHQDLAAYRRREGSSPNWEDWQPILARSHEHSTQVDAAMGRVVDSLERLGLLDNTIIIYTADHGGTMASNGELVDKGWLMVDETVRIPLAVSWPGKIAASTTTDQFVSNMDIVPTILEAAEAEMPDPLDGRSFLSLAQAPTETDWPADLMIQHHGHYDEIHFQRQLRYDRYKYTAHLDDTDELYDLSTDPYELNNLIDAPDFAEVLQEIRQRLYRWMVRHEDDSDWSKQLFQQMGVD
ncbi:MAG: sulfatase-like hydrolase/transferase [Chloroflexota bacterium]